MVARESADRALQRSLKARREALRELVLRRSPRLPSLVKRQEEAFRKRVRRPSFSPHFPPTVETLHVRTYLAALCASPC